MGRAGIGDGPVVDVQALEHDDQEAGELARRGAGCYLAGVAGALEGGCECVFHIADLPEGELPSGGVGGLSEVMGHYLW